MITNELLSAFERLIIGHASSNDLQLLRQALRDGRVSATFATQGGVAIGGDASHNVIITIVGNNNTIILPEEVLQQLMPAVTPAPDIRPLDLSQAEQSYRQQVVRHYNRPRLGKSLDPDRFLDSLPIDKIFTRLTFTQTQHVNQPDQGKTKENADTPKTIRSEVEVALPETLTRYPCLAILGNPGYGKSTLVAWLAVTFAAGVQGQIDRLGPQYNRPLLPVVVRLSRLPHTFSEDELSQKPLQQILSQCMDVSLSSIVDVYPMIESVHKEGRCLWLLDGLDEVAEPLRGRFVQALEKFAAGMSLTGNQLIVTSRPAVSYEIGNFFDGVERSRPTSDSRSHAQTMPILTIERFSPQDVELFFRKHYELDSELSKAEAEEKASNLIGQLQNIPRCFDLARVPLMATLLFLLHRKDGQLPERRVDVYAKLSLRCLDHWQNDRTMPDANKLSMWPLHLKAIFLGRLALYFQENDKSSFGRDSLLGPIQKILDQDERFREHKTAAEDVLATAGLRSGLLTQSEDGFFEYLHATFQDFFAACGLASEMDFVELVKKDVYAPNWQDTHAMLLGLLGSAPGTPAHDLLWLCKQDARKAGEQAYSLVKAVLNQPHNTQLAIKIERALGRQELQAAMYLREMSKNVIPGQLIGEVAQRLDALFRRYFELALKHGPETPVWQIAAQQLHDLDIHPAALLDRCGVLISTATPAKTGIGKIARELFERQIYLEVCIVALDIIGYPPGDVLPIYQRALSMERDDGALCIAAAQALANLGMKSRPVQNSLREVIEHPFRVPGRSWLAIKETSIALGRLGGVTTQLLSHLIANLKLEKLEYTYTGKEEMDEFFDKWWQKCNTQWNAWIAIGELWPYATSSQQEKVIQLSGLKRDNFVVAGYGFNQSTGFPPDPDIQGYQLSLDAYKRILPTLEKLFPVQPSADDIQKDVEWVFAALDHSEPSLEKIRQVFWSIPLDNPDVSVLGITQRLMEKAFHIFNAHQNMLAAMLMRLGDHAPELINDTIIEFINDPQNQHFRHAFPDEGEATILNCLVALKRYTPTVINTLISRLQNPSVENAIVKIGIQEPQLIVDAVAEKVITSPGEDSWAIRFTGLGILGEIGWKSPVILQLFVNAMRDPESSIRNKAWENILKLTPQISEENMRVLFSASQEGDIGLDRVIVALLDPQFISPNKIELALLHVLSAQQANVRRAAVALTSLIPYQSAPIRNRLNEMRSSDDSLWIRAILECRLTSSSVPEHYMPLQILQVVRRISIQENADSELITIFQGLDHQAARSAIDMLLHDSDWHARRTGIVTLRKTCVFPESDRLAIILPMVSDLSWLVRAEAAHALGDFANLPPDSLNTLAACLADPDGAVIFETRKSLAKLAATDLEAVIYSVAVLDDVADHECIWLMDEFKARPIPGLLQVLVKEFVSQDTRRRKRVASMIYRAYEIHELIEQIPLLEKLDPALYADVLLESGQCQDGFIEKQIAIALMGLLSKPPDQIVDFLAYTAVPLNNDNEAHRNNSDMYCAAAALRLLQESKEYIARSILKRFGDVPINQYRVLRQLKNKPYSIFEIFREMAQRQPKEMLRLLTDVDFGRAWPDQYLAASLLSALELAKSPVWQALVDITLHKPDETVSEEAFNGLKILREHFPKSLRKEWAMLSYRLAKELGSDHDFYNHDASNMQVLRVKLLGLCPVFDLGVVALILALRDEYYVMEASVDVLKAWGRKEPLLVAKRVAAFRDYPDDGDVRKYCEEVFAMLVEHPAVLAWAVRERIPIPQKPPSVTRDSNPDHPAKTSLTPEELRKMFRLKTFGQIDKQVFLNSIKANRQDCIRILSEVTWDRENAVAFSRFITEYPQAILQRDKDYETLLKKVIQPLASLLDDQDRILEWEPLFHLLEGRFVPGDA